MFPPGQSTSIYQFMPTPVKNTENKSTVRRKAKNYSGTQITKDLFDKNKEEKKLKGPQPPKLEVVIKKTKRVGGGGHCCEEDKMVNLRQCHKCGKWYHEECVGLSADDTNNFECC